MGIECFLIFKNCPRVGFKLKSHFKSIVMNEEHTLFQLLKVRGAQNYLGAGC